MTMNRKLFDTLHPPSDSGAYLSAKGMPQWAIAYHTNSHGPRAKRWYRISRLIFADNAWFELYWHPEVTLRGDSVKDIHNKAKAYGLKLLPGVYRDVPPPRNGSAMERAQ